jgi:hypothetical protein
MSHELYIFGSTTRGDVSPTSDVDILVLPFTSGKSNFPENWSIYSPNLIQSYFNQGRLFAWHLYLESQCIFTPNGTPYLDTLGAPTEYSTKREDIEHLRLLLRNARDELSSGTNSVIYELGIVYTAVRDIAMSASWDLLEHPSFSRNAPFELPIKCPLEFSVYEQAMRARHSSTRGTDMPVDLKEVTLQILRAPLDEWIEELRR